MSDTDRKGGEPRRVIVDTDTAGDDTQALVLAAAATGVEIEGVTICAGNVDFDDEAENAKYVLDMVGLTEDVTVYEGARAPLLKEYHTAEYVHGEGGLGGSLHPDTGIDSGDRHAADYIVDAARERPGELTLVCIAPLTNVALALRKEPKLNELLESVWVMGGNVNCLGNVTPAAEFNFWVDPDAAKMVLNELDVTLFDWGVSVRDTAFDTATLERIEAMETTYAEFYADIATSVRAFNRESLGEDVTTQPDSGLVAALAAPDLIEQSATYHVDVDEREGLTRGYTAVDENGVGDGDPRTEVIESLDADGFRELFLTALSEGSVGAE